jgi:uncharacterized protein involved in cysteine biosynthesis
MDSYRVANRMIWRQGLWRYWIIPALLSVLYLPLLVWGISLGADVLADQLKWGGTEGTLGWWLWRVFLWGVFGVIGWLTYRSVVLLFHAPFLDAISERVERELRGHDVVPAMTWLPMAVRSVKVAMVTGSIALVLAVLNAVLSFVPVLGWIISFGILVPMQLWLGGVQAVDPVLGRNGDRARVSLSRCLRRPLAVLLIGGVGTLIMLIPLVGWFVGPTYMVVAGVVAGMRMREADSGLKALPSS